MNQQELSKLSDKDLLEEAGNIKPSAMVDALLIGFLVGIIIFSLAVSSWGFLTIIPLFFIYLLLKKSKRYEAIKKEKEERGLH